MCVSKCVCVRMRACAHMAKIPPLNYSCKGRGLGKGINLICECSFPISANYHLSERLMPAGRWHPQAGCSVHLLSPCAQLRALLPVPLGPACQPPRRPRQ